MQSIICSNTKQNSYGSLRKWMSNFTKLHLTHEILEFYLYNHSSCEIWHLFSRTSMTNFLWCYYRWFIISLALEKCKKECNILSIILVQDFCPLKIKITQSLYGNCLKLSANFGTVARDTCFPGRQTFQPEVNLKRLLI